MPHLKCNLSKILGERKMSQLDLAERAELNKNTIARLYHEKNITKVPIKTFFQICTTLNIPLSELIEIQPCEKSEGIGGQRSK